LRNAVASEEPVSTSSLRSITSFPTAGWRRPSDDLEGLQQRHAGLHHGRELAVKSAMSLVLILPPPFAFCFFDLLHHDALAAQGGADRGLADRAYFAAHDLAALSLPPGER